MVAEYLTARKDVDIPRRVLRYLKSIIFIFLRGLHSIVTIKRGDFVTIKNKGLVQHIDDGAIAMFMCIHAVAHSHMYFCICNNAFF